MSANLPHNFIRSVDDLTKKVRDLQGMVSSSTPRRGTVVLSAGTATVAMISVTAKSQIMLTIQIPGGTVGSPFVFSRSAGTSFTIHSTSSLDTSTVAYQVTEPG